MENRRHFTRILFSINAEINIEEEIYPVSIYDISLNGALISAVESKIPLKGKTGVLRFSLSDNDTVVIMKVTIAHEEESEIGLQCHSMDINSLTHLRRLLELNLGDSKQLDKELNQLSSKI